MNNGIDTRYTQDRELSWLCFNERVLAEAKDESVPLMERLKFAAIFASNLDEFFMVRVGSLHDMSLVKEPHIDSRTGKTPQEQLQDIFRAVVPLYKQRDRILEELETRCRACNICRLRYEELDSRAKKQAAAWFENELRPILSPQIVDLHHPFPHLPNKGLSIVLNLQADGKELLGILQIPSSLPLFLRLEERGVHYILTEDILLEFTNQIFGQFVITDQAVICVTRNADISPEDEAYDVDMDFRQHMRKIMKKRTRLAPVRLEVQGGKDGKLAEYLCAAAENGKQVTVLMELRARFDEQNNILWAERLEEVGCTLLYGFEGIKVHSKVCLIIRRERGRVRYITQIGTGNYNEKTAKQYTDLCLMTANQEIGEDAALLFQNMATANLKGEYAHLLVSPFALKEKVIACIDGEIAKGSKGYIFLKLNSLTDRKLIDKLSEASRAGVEVVMNIRGICCLLPGIEGLTEHIRVFSIVGRYLEHSRIYCFGRGESAKLYISSADFMTRNTERRVEVACPVLDQETRARLFHIIDGLQRDNVKARLMRPDGTWHRIKDEEVSFSCQEAFQQEMLRAETEAKSNDGAGNPVKGLAERL